LDNNRTEVNTIDISSITGVYKMDETRIVAVKYDRRIEITQAEIQTIDITGGFIPDIHYNSEQNKILCSSGEINENFLNDIRLVKQLTGYNLSNFVYYDADDFIDTLKCYDYEVKFNKTHT
jgi:hypothetical protein